MRPIVVLTLGLAVAGAVPPAAVAAAPGAAVPQALLGSKRRSNVLTGLALLVALLLFAGWAVFLDAATHGWDDLKLLWL
jgi:hypothetical protein